MTNAELIAKLQTMPQDDPVYFINGDGLDLVTEVSQAIIGIDDDGNILEDGTGLDIILLECHAEEEGAPQA